MECFDRVGERERLTLALKDQYPLILVSGKSGVGKSEIVETVLENLKADSPYLKYEYGRVPLSLSRFLMANLREYQSKRSKLLNSIQSVSVKEVSLSVPFVGKAPIRWGNGKVDLNLDSLGYEDISIGLSGPLFKDETKAFEKIKSLLAGNKFQALWVANAEIASASDFAQICLGATYLTSEIPVIIEGAFSEIDLKVVERILREIADDVSLTFSSHRIRPFNTNFAKRFHKYLGLDKDGIAFNFTRNAGYPVAIKFDLEATVNSSSMSTRLQACIDYSKSSAQTLLFLTLFYSIENRYSKIMELADCFDVTLEFGSLLNNNMLRLSETVCELSHPRIAQFILITQRPAIRKMLREYYDGNNGNNNIEADLAALGHTYFLDENVQIELFRRGIKYVFEILEENKFDTAENSLGFIEDGIEKLIHDGGNVSDSILDTVSILRMQVDTVLCRWSGIISDPVAASPAEILLSAQVRMRQIDLREAIGLTHLAQSKIQHSRLASGQKYWLDFCAMYIRASCHIALGEFDAYEKLIGKITTAAELVSKRGKSLSLLLPDSSLPKTQSVPKVDAIQPFVKARLENNWAVSHLFRNCNNPELETLFKNAINIVASDGSVELTFPMNNLALFYLYNGKLDIAADIFYDTISYCIYPYDHFAAYNNLAIAVAALGDIEQAMKYSELAHKYVEAEELTDPVFVIKSYFNNAVLARATGDQERWENLRSKRFIFERMPKRYKDLFDKKIEAVSTVDSSVEIFGEISGNNIELASVLWPQNLQFWDFMYPIIDEQMAKDISKSRLQNV